VRVKEKETLAKIVIVLKKVRISSFSKVGIKNGIKEKERMCFDEFCLMQFCRKKILLHFLIELLKLRHTLSKVFSSNSTF